MAADTVLCIGGSSGMGRGIAEAAIEAGMQVGIAARSRAKVDAVARELGCSGYVVDLQSNNSVKSLFEQAGPFDQLAITAGATGRSSFSKTSPAEAAEFMNAKLWGAHSCIWQARPYMNEHGGITLITGGYANRLTDAAGHVTVAFQAVEAMARVAALSLAPIRCNVLRPGFVDTALWDHLEAKERFQMREDEQRKTPTGSLVSPLEFGRCAVRIMQSTPINGAVIPVDGGRHLHNAD